MPDLAGNAHAQQHRRARPPERQCHECRRTPLAGERLHELGSGQQLCELCFGALPDESRRAVRSQRVHASERRLAVVPKAA